MNYLELKQLYGIEEISEYVERTTCGSMATEGRGACGAPGKWVFLIDWQFYVMCGPHTVLLMGNPAFKNHRLG